MLIWHHIRNTMSQRSMMKTSVSQLAEAIKSVLHNHADQAGVATGFIQRVREFTGATFAQTMILGQMQEGEIAMSDLATFARQVGVNVSAQAIDKRFTQKTATFFKSCSMRALRKWSQRIQWQFPYWNVLAKLS